MQISRSMTKSCWMENSNSAFGELQEDIDAAVCVVGAGIAGLTTAYLLQREGLNVVVVDSGQVGGGETSKSTAHITHALDDRYLNLEKMHGADGSRKAAESHTAAIQVIDDIVQREHIDCEFQRIDGYLFAGSDQSNELVSERDAAQRAGLLEVTLLNSSPLPFLTGPLLCFPNQAEFNPLKYLNGLASCIVRSGGRIFTDTHVVSIEGGDQAAVKMEAGHEIRAKAIVVATNTPINDRYVMHTKQAAYRSYVVGFKVEKDQFPHVLLWDTEDPYHYVRVATGTDPSHEILIVGGEDHKTGQADDGEQRFAQLVHWARSRFGELGTVQWQWSGQIVEPNDGLAFIGRNPTDADNVFIATGDSGNGITHGTIAGIILSDLIQGKANPWADLYAPSRKPIHAVGEFARENVNVVAQYADWLTPAEYASVSEIPAGAGGLLRIGVKRVAAYKDESGSLYFSNAACPHLGCLVAWNDTEKSWDCPCHGSRFTGCGDVICGPSKAGLESVEKPPL